MWSNYNSLLVEIEKYAITLENNLEISNIKVNVNLP